MGAPRPLGMSQEIPSSLQVQEQAHVAMHQVGLQPHQPLALDMYNTLTVASAGAGPCCCASSRRAAETADNQYDSPPLPVCGHASGDGQGHSGLGYPTALTLHRTMLHHKHPGGGCGRGREGKE